MKKLLGIFLVAGIGGITSLEIDHLLKKQEVNYGDKQIASRDVKLVSMPESPAEPSVNFVNAAELTVHAVVHIKTSLARDNRSLAYSNDPFYNLFFGVRPQQQAPLREMSAGSGVIISGDGYIITNNHVIEGADKIEVVLNDKRSYPATIIGRDPNTDLALIKIKEQNLPVVSYGNSDELKVGEWVLAVGNPFNLTSTVTAGIVSAKGRNLDILESDPEHGVYPIESYIQTDAAINPGNSGGALVNTNGQLVGINAAIKTNTGSYSGYSFAIPVNIVKKVTADLLEFGEVQRAFLGISIQDIDAKLAAERKIKDFNGVFVNAVTEGGAGEDAGIKAGDIITKIADVKVDNVTELQEQVGKFRPGDQLLISFKRNGNESAATLTLKNRKGNTSMVKKETPEALSVLGASFEQAAPDELKRLRIRNGLKIVRLNGGKLRAAGINEGFIITKVDKKDVSTLDELKNAIENKDGGILIEGIYTNGIRGYYGFGM